MSKVAVWVRLPLKPGVRAEAAAAFQVAVDNVQSEDGTLVYILHEEEADPDDVEEDLDTILRDRITAGTDEEDEDEEAPVDDRTEAGDRVAPRAAEEHSCPACFLLVRRSQFSSKRTDCPGGFDGDDCPMKATFA